MKKGDLLFVYGTLMSGERMGLDKGFYSMGVKLLGPDRINGLIYSLGSFPGVKVEDSTGYNNDSPVVEGEVYLLRDDGIVSILDSYEGFPNLYGRSTVESEMGRRVHVYVYNHEVREESRIENGSWKHRGERKAA